MKLLQRQILLVGIMFHCFFTGSSAQQVSPAFTGKIGTPMLNPFGNQQGFPMLVLGGNSRLLLSFDDLEGGIKSYYYTYQLCNYNWQPANLSTMDFIKGFVQNRISTYRYSSVALTNYTHYEAILPDANSVPVKSGNYILKVFLNGDTSNLVFTKRMVVVEPLLTVQARVLQPFTPELFNTHQRIRIDAVGQNLGLYSASQQIKAVILQNNRWDNAMGNIPPTFIRGSTLEFNSENVGSFPAGKEWRWLDLRSFRLQSDRVRDGSYTKTSTELFLKPDADRSSIRYTYFPDYNGMFNIETYEQLNPNWQGDYATVHFYFDPGDLNLQNKKIFLLGAFNNYGADNGSVMRYDEASRLYTASAYLKQGYYNYAYALKGDGEKEYKMLEGDYFETENIYTTLIYYKSFSDRNDRLIGFAQVNSRSDRPGFSF